MVRATQYLIICLLVFLGGEVIRNDNKINAAGNTSNLKVTIESVEGITDDVIDVKILVLNSGTSMIRTIKVILDINNYNIEDESLISNLSHGESRLIKFENIHIEKRVASKINVRAMVAPNSKSLASADLAVLFFDGAVGYIDSMEKYNKWLKGYLKRINRAYQTDNNISQTSLSKMTIGLPVADDVGSVNSVKRKPKKTSLCEKYSSIKTMIGKRDFKISPGLYNELKDNGYDMAGIKKGGQDDE